MRYLSVYAILVYSTYNDNLFSELWNERVEVLFGKVDTTFLRWPNWRKEGTTAVFTPITNRNDWRWQLGITDINLIITMEVIRRPILIVDVLKCARLGMRCACRRAWIAQFEIFKPFCFYSYSWSCNLLLGYAIKIILMGWRVSCAYTRLHS